MKKLLVIITCLAIVLISMIVYRNLAVGTTNNVTIKEINDIQEYISNIYMWKEVTGEALPKFDDINQADDLWVWEVVNQNLEKFDLTYEDIQSTAKKIFGQAFTKEFPKERNRNNIL